MEEQIKQLMAVVNGQAGWFASAVAIRGFLAFIAPLFNTWVQSMLTEALNASPKVTNSVVSSNWWKVLNFILRSTTSMKLPSEASMLILQARKSGDTQILTK